MNKEDKTVLIQIIKALPHTFLKVFFFVLILLFAANALLQDHQGKIAEATLNMIYCTWVTIVAAGWKIVWQLNRKDKS